MLRLFADLKIEKNELTADLLVNIRKPPADQLHEIFLRDDRHVKDCKTRCERFVELPRSRIPVIHCRDKTCLRLKLHPGISRNIQNAPEIKGGMEDGEGFIFSHIDLIEDTESALYGCKKDGSFPENDTAPVICIRPDQIGRVCSDVERDVPDRPQESCSEILGQDIFSGRLRTGEQKVPAGKNRGERLLPHFLSVIHIFRMRDPFPISLIDRICPPKFLHSSKKLLTNSFPTKNC